MFAFNKILLVLKRNTFSYLFQETKILWVKGELVKGIDYLKKYFFLSFETEVHWLTDKIIMTSLSASLVGTLVLANTKQGHFARMDSPIQGYF